MTLVCLITRSTARRADARVTFSRGVVCHVHSARTWAGGQKMPAYQIDITQRNLYEPSCLTS